MNETTTQNQKRGDADTASPKTGLPTHRCETDVLSARSLNVFLAVAILAVSLGCSDHLRPKLPPLRHLLTEKFDPAFARKPNKDEENIVKTTSRSDSESAPELDSGIALAGFQQESAPPVEELPMPDVPQNFERIHALEQPNSNALRSRSATSGPPPLRPNRDILRQPMPQATDGRLTINMQGTRIRDPNETATEVSLRQKATIANLQQENVAGQTERRELLRLLDVERKEHKRTDSQLANGVKEILRLRKLTAKLQVQLDDLLIENKRIRDESEAALKAIESNLDAALLQSIASKRDN